MVAINVTDRHGKKHKFEGKAARTLMEVLRDNNMEIEAICGGCCSCATCHVLIEPKWVAKLPPQTHDEQDLVRETGSYDPKRSRLSCQIAMKADLDGLTLTIAPSD